MAGNSKIENLYSRFVTEFIEDLKSDDFYAYFTNMLRSGTSNMALNEKYVERNIDLRWVEAIEDTIIPLDTIIRNPNRYIKNMEEVVPIEMARTISTESVRHLATHTNFIAHVKGDDVTPHHILNVIKEESFDTYENRFIFTLLFKLEYFLDKRMQILMANKKVADKYEMHMDGSCTAGHDELTYDIKMNYVTPHVELTEEELEVGADVSKLSSLQRIERLRKILYSFKSSALMKALTHCAMVRPPLTMTNVLTKNPNFKKCVDLWSFIESYEDVGFSVNVVEREATPSSEYLADMFSLITLQYVVMKKNTSRTGEIGDYAERRNEIQPNVVKKSIEDIIETYDLDINEFKRVFIDQIEKKRKKVKAEFAKIKEVIKRAIATDKEYLVKYNARREQRVAREQARIREEEKEARLEQERLEQLAREEQERIEQERLEQERIEQERLEQERLAEIENQKAVEEVANEEPSEAVEEVAIEEPSEEVEEVANEEPSEAVEEVANEEPSEAVEEVANEEPSEAVEEVAIEEPSEAVEEVANEEPSEAVEEVANEEPSEAVEEVAIEEKSAQESFVKRLKDKISLLWSKLRKKEATQVPTETQVLEEAEVSEEREQEATSTTEEEVAVEEVSEAVEEIAVVNEETEILEEPVIEESTEGTEEVDAQDGAAASIEKKERIDKRKAKRMGRTRSLPKNYKIKTKKK